MTWYSWVIVALIAWSSLTCVMRIGKPREPLDGGSVVVILIFNGLMIWAIFALAERCS